MATAAPNASRHPATWRRAVLAGRIVSSVVVAMLALDALAKLVMPETMICYSPPLGLAPDSGLYRAIGAVLMACLALHVWPRTRVLGAVLVTGFLGGAVAVNLRAGMPLFVNTLFGVYLGAALWLGLYLRDARVRALLF